MRTCKVCKKRFKPDRPFQRACSPECALIYIKQKAGQKAIQKQIRKETRERKQASKSRQDWLRECQAIANRYARVRDMEDGCISCDKPASWSGQWHGSHFRSAGAASAVRLNLWNIHKACSVCNHHKSGNIAEYRPRLIEKIGLEKVEWLECQNHLVRYDIEYLKRYKNVMGKRLRVMEKRKGFK